MAGDAIGTDGSGVSAVGNGRDGVRIDAGATRNTVGGTAMFEANQVAARPGIGVDRASPPRPAARRADPGPAAQAPGRTDPTVGPVAGPRAATSSSNSPSCRLTGSAPPLA